MIIFKTIRYKNFLSTGNVFTEIDLSSERTTLIVGKNGSGKSTLADAITYVLFGKPFRKINKPQLLNSLNGKDLVVEIEFSIGSTRYKVIRGQKPYFFEIYKNEVLLNQDAAVRDYQEVLEKQILRMNYKTFCQVVILGAASFIPFMSLPTGSRREIIEDILDLQIFTTMNQLLKEKIATNSSSVKDIEYEIRLVDSKIVLSKEHHEALKRDTEQLIEDLRSKIVDSKKFISKTNEDILSNSRKREELLDGLDDPSKISSRLGKVNSLSSQLSAKLSRLDEEISFYNDNETCPTCHQLITLETKHEHLESKTKIHLETSEALVTLRDRIVSTKNKLEETNKIYDECTALNMANASLMSSISSCEKTIVSFTKEIETLENKKTSLGAEDIDKLESEKKALEKKKKKLLQEKEVYGISSIMLKDSGIKSRLIKQYIPIINKNINKYLSSMDFYVSFELDENFNETMKSRHRDEFSYSSFSEGEKARINLAVLFTWRVIAKLRNSASTNLLILDETFDNSMDGDGVEELIKLLDASSEDSNIVVISHKTDAMLDRFDRTIKFEKIKNFSEMEIL